MEPSPFGGMNKLPIEISDLICDFSDKDYESSKNLRLTSRRFYSRATKNVFRGLLIHHHPDSYAKVNNVAQSQELSSLVETLYLPREHDLYFPLKDRYYTGGDFENWAKRTIVSWGYGTGEVQKGGNSCPLPSQTDPEHDRILQEAFARFEYWRKGQEEVQDWLADILDRQEDGLPPLERVLLNPLPRLHTIECLERLDLVALNRRKYGDKCYGLTRIELEILDGEMAERGWQFYSPSNNNFRLIFLEHQRDGSGVTTLNLKDVKDLDWKHFGFNLPHLRSLTIDPANVENRAPREDQRYEDWRNPWVPSRPLAIYIPPMANIELLTVMQPQTNLNADLLGAFNLRRFAKLRELHLKYITTKATTLLDFVAAHRGSLERIVIDQPLIQPTQWARVKEAIEALFETKKGTTLVLTDSFRPENSSIAAEWPEPERTEGSDTAAKWWSILGLEFGTEMRWAWPIET